MRSLGWLEGARRPYVLQQGAGYYLSGQEHGQVRRFGLAAAFSARILSLTVIVASCFPPPPRLQPGHRDLKHSTSSILPDSLIYMTASSRRTTTAHDRETAKLSDIRRATEALLATKSESPSKSQQAPIHAARIPEMEWSESVWSWLSRPNHEDAVASCLAAEVLGMDEVHPKNKCTQRYCSHIHVKTYTTALAATYYRLGRVPCMHVRLVGTLVGIMRYEKKPTHSFSPGYHRSS